MGEGRPNHPIWMMHFFYWGDMISVVSWLAGAMWKQVIAVFKTELCNSSLNQSWKRRIEHGAIGSNDGKRIPDVQ